MRANNIGYKGGHKTSGAFRCSINQFPSKIFLAVAIYGIESISMPTPYKLVDIKIRTTPNKDKIKIKNLYLLIFPFDKIII